MITAILHRRRLVFWLIRAYIKRSKRAILAFFIAGILISLVGYFALPHFPIVPWKTERIGIVGSHTVETLPFNIQNEISLGLTHVSQNGEASPSAAVSFEVSSDGKTYAFFLRDDLFWQDGKKFTAHDVNYNFKDVKTEARGKKEVVFALEEPYAPFPIVVSRPLFKEGLVGLRGSQFGAFKVVGIKLSGSFIEELIVEGNIAALRNKHKTYRFYPNEEAARMAFMLGEIDVLHDLLDVHEFIGWKNVAISKHTANDQLVTLFYNTSIPPLSQKNVRQALTYAIPRDFQGEKSASSPLAPSSWAFAEQEKFTYNIEAAKKLLSESEEATKSGRLAFIITTTPRFKDLANSIKEAWDKLDVETNIEVVKTIPTDPQILLERFRIPDDPDQYVLWHSTQSTNISRFANPKIDKLLEDGRQIVNQEERVQIYTDFQKHIVEEAPATFLYYPTVYTISRK